MPRHIPFYNDESGVSILNLRAPKGIDVESWFIECYKKHKGHPMQILLGLYKGNYHKFFLAVIFFFIKHAPVWVLPIVTANIINDITSGSPETYQNIIIQAMIMIVLVALNIPMNYMYTRYKSLATRYAETGLRRALVESCSSYLYLIIRKRSQDVCNPRLCEMSKRWKHCQRRCFLAYLI